MAFFDPSVNTSSDQSVRRALLPLARLAEKHHCVILLIRHLNKTGRRQSLYRGGGSIGIVGACRSAWLFAADPVVAGRRVMAPVKNNLAPDQPSLAYELPTREADPLAVVWLGQSNWSANQLLTPQHADRPAAQRDRACDFLAEVLGQGPRTSREIWAEALKQGVAEHTLRRAKGVLEVRSVRVWADGQRLSYWLLPGQQLPQAADSEDDSTDLEPWLAPLRAQFPPPTPLDEL
jgi:hypothetical protein